MVELHVLVTNDILGIERHQEMLLPIVKVFVGKPARYRGCPLRGALVHKRLSADGVLITIPICEMALAPPAWVR